MCILVVDVKGIVVNIGSYIYEYVLVVVVFIVKIGNDFYLEKL